MGKFHTLRTLSITTTQCILDYEIESAMSDDSDIARSMIRRRRDLHDAPGDEAQDVVATAFFECCLALNQLCLVDWGIPTRWGVTRSSDGFVEAVESLEPDDESINFPISYESIQKHQESLDDDGFPKVLSFPREILTSRTDQDPPNYGREPEEEREATVRHCIPLSVPRLTQYQDKEKWWYMECWRLYQSNT
jgi:hypothetical protein